jgi:uncharacterized membrane protein (UPF0127 family)
MAVRPRSTVIARAVASVTAAVIAAGCATEPTPAAPPVTDDVTQTTHDGTASDGTTSEPATSAASAAVLPDGFERVAATATAADGSVCELCLWLADDGDRRARGLMFVTDLGPADGMAFVYDSPRTGNFWMKNTLLPLSIAFFDADGGYLDAFDMEPCVADPCDRYRTPNDFLVAIETTQGDLDALGIGPGTVLTLTDMPCR